MMQKDEREDITPEEQAKLIEEQIELARLLSVLAQTQGPQGAEQIIRNEMMQPHIPPQPPQPPQIGGMGQAWPVIPR